MKRGHDKRANEKHTLSKLQKADRAAILSDPLYPHFDAIDYARRKRLYWFWDRLARKPLFK